MYLNSWCCSFNLLCWFSHCKKELAIFPSPAGMSLTKLSLGGKKINYSRPGRVWSVTSRLGTGKRPTLFNSAPSDSAPSLLPLRLCPRVSSKQTKINFGSNRNKPKQDLFRVCFGLFRETKNLKIRFVSVVRTYIETTETNRSVS
jgi:hypothetical protein